MTSWSIAWDPNAVAKASRYLEDDPDGLAQLIKAVDLLAADPRPRGSIPYGSDDLRRLHAGLYRVLYEIGPGELTITIIHVGRLT